MSRPAGTHVKEWSAFYGLDKRQARRLRRRVAKGDPRDIPCNVKGCILRLYNPKTGQRHIVHFIKGKGPSL